MPGFFPGARENIAVPDDRKGQIVFKWPDHEIRRFTHAIVAPDELAVFMYQGQVKGTLPPEMCIRDRAGRGASRRRAPSAAAHC